jgi:manganese/zinc/iron transport system permease protein
MLKFFTDPLLRGPLLASMLMCFTVSLIGVLIVLRKRSLLAETLSHATYPGVTLALIFTALLGFEESFSFWILSGAFIAAFCGFQVVDFL